MKHLIFFWGCLMMALSAVAQLPAGFVKVEIANGLNPTDLAIANDGRVFLTEKDGIVWVVEHDVLLPDPFLILSVEDFNEQGLGHIALHPDFPNTPFVYVYYTVADSNGLSHNRVSRVTADGNLAISGSEVVLYECDPSAGTIHHGGDLLFGKDGKLYVATGDKGLGVQVQSLESDLGKVLRLNPDGSFPSDNPFFQTAQGKYRSIYALGLRNPFSMALQPETGRIFISDVGASVWEEVNELFPGRNYGWPLIEGPKTTQNPPPAYSDPFYAYDHNAGCSIIGATFSPLAGNALPAAYRGKFFFADYCQGYIKMLDTHTFPGVATFATAINRPVGLAFNAQSALYFLARAGLGGGSVEDNTESENGSLWKIVYTGSEAPFVFQHPQSALLVAGETYTLKVQATGRPPLHYRWQKNGQDLFMSDTNVVALPQVQLVDSNTIFRCIVYNEFGQDTSLAAQLRVTLNQRPQLQMIYPDTAFRYRAGAEIPFEALAFDPETGALHPNATSWKIDFHHDEHIHPVMIPTAGLGAETLPVPAIGEVDDHVWYRFSFSAKDPAGLGNTIFRDVFPLKIPLRVTSNEANIPVDLDGLWGFTPFERFGVAGLQRQASVPGFVDRLDSVLFFNRWQDGLKTFRHPFITPDSGSVHFHADFHRIAKARGIGLLGEYYAEKFYPWSFDEPLLRSRIDTTVFFQWGEGSPEPGYIPNDGFCVRWSGEVLPYLDDIYTFYTFTDDGARLWVNDSLLIDQWMPQGGTEYRGQLYLEGGKRYAIRFEFLELGGVATAQLSWSTDRMPQTAIPKTQLFPPKHLIPNQINGRIWQDTDHNQLWEEPEEALVGASVVLLHWPDLTAFAGALTNQDGEYRFEQVPAGMYVLYVLPPLNQGLMEAGYGLFPDGSTAPFSLEGEQTASFDFSFYPLDSGLAGGAPEWTISPNPTVGPITVKKNVRAYEHAFELRLFNAQGRLIQEARLPEKSWEKTLDFHHLPAGLYLLSDGTRHYSFIKR